MEKIAINIVGVGPSSDDVSTQILNFSGGFRAVTGKIVSRDADSLYLGITSDRAYIVTVEGDLSLSTETSDSFDCKIAGVTGFDIDWTLTAKQFGNGSGKIIVTNPDTPSEVSTFEVFMGEPRSVVVDFAANTGCLVLDICEDVWPPHVLVGSRNFSPRGDLDGVKVNSPDVVAAFVRSFEAMICTNNNGRSDMSNDDVVITGSFNLDDRSRPANAEEVVGHELAKPDYITCFGDFNEGGRNPFGDSLAILLPLIEATALDRVSDHSSCEKPAMRDFGQLGRTRDNDVSRIAASVAAANDLGIDTSNVAPRRDAALARLAVLSDRFKSGGLQPVTEAEVAVINEVFGELWSIHSDLDTLVSHWHHYKGHEANHDRWEERLADRKRDFKVPDDAGDNSIATSYVTYAASPEETLAASKAAFVELFQAIQKGDLRAAHQADTRARQFSTREHLLDALVRRGKLVVVEEVSTTA
jgi:hypothetical protein